MIYPLTWLKEHIDEAMSKDSFGFLASYAVIAVIILIFLYVYKVTLSFIKSFSGFTTKV